VSATRADAERWLREGREAMLVELVKVRGSVPREAGTRMLVSADALCGTIGGGHLEHASIGQARALLRETPSPDAPRAMQRRLALGPALGQCCGGSVEVAWQQLDDTAVRDWPAPALRFRLQLHGAGHVGRALMHILWAVPCSVDWIDAREGFAADHAPAHPQQAASGAGPVAMHHPGSMLAQVRLHAGDVPQDLLHLAQAGDYVLIATHRHDLDEEIAAAALRRDELAWIGMIGSASKRARILKRLVQRGLDPERAERLVCPIGIPGYQGVGAKEPGVIALAVAAQLLQTSAQSARAPHR